MSEPAPAPHAEPERRGGAERGELRRAGELWQMGYAGAQVHLPNLKGLSDLAVLLASPHREVPALDLAASVAAPDRDVAGNDLHAAGDLGERSTRPPAPPTPPESASCRPTSTRPTPPGRAERGARLQEELDFLTRELSGAYGLHGPRRAGDPAEKARAAVTARIRAVLTKIREVHPALGRHLDHSITTGRFCCYRPDESVSWTVVR